jgi:hypothetical protein
VNLLEKIDMFQVQFGTSFGPDHYRKFVEKNHEEGSQ